MLRKLFTTLSESAISFSIAGVIGAVVKEMGQELVIDPWIESTVSGLVRRAGGDAYIQMILSSIAESGREAISGPLSSLFSGSQQAQQQSLSERLDSKYVSKGLKPTMQQFLTEISEYKADIASQQEQNAEQMASLRGANKVLSFISLATGFAGSFLLGPFGVLAYTTIATYCLTEGISLKNVFRKAFNPVTVAISNSKVADYVRNNKKQVLLALGIGVASLGWMALQALLPALGGFGAFGSLGIGFGGITIGMVNINNEETLIKENRKNIDTLYYSMAQMTHHLYKILKREMFRFDKKFDFSKDLQYLKEKFDEYYAIWAKNHKGEYWIQKGATKINILSTKDGHSYEWFLDKFLEAYEDVHGTRDDETTKFFRDYGNFMQFIKGQAFENLRTPIKPRVVLIESLIDIFPKFWGVPFSYNRLAKLIFTKDTASLFLGKRRLDKRIDFTQLLEIDYNTYKLTEARFDSIGIKISSDQLKKLKSTVSQFIKEFVFLNPFVKPYINKYDKETSKVYVESKYDLYRGLYFLESENKGRSISFNELIDTIETEMLNPGRFLVYGNMLRENRNPYKKIRSYILSQPKNSHLRDITHKAFKLHSRSLKRYLPKLVGIYTHLPIELLTMMSLKSHSFTIGVESEQPVGRLGKQVDLSIPISATFLTAIGTLSKIIPNGIRELVVDFTHEAKRPKLKDYYITKKYYKEYQSKDRFLFIVLTHPSFTKSDIDQLTKDLNQRDPAFAKNIKIMLLDEFLITLKVQEKIKSKIEDLYNLVDDCLQRNDLDLRDESLDKLKNIYEQAKLILKFPLSQLRLTQFKGSFFNID